MRVEPASTVRFVAFETRQSYASLLVISSLSYLHMTLPSCLRNYWESIEISGLLSKPSYLLMEFFCILKLKRHPLIGLKTLILYQMRVVKAVVPIQNQSCKMLVINHALTRPHMLYKAAQDCLPLIHMPREIFCTHCFTHPQLT